MDFSEMQILKFRDFLIKYIYFTNDEIETQQMQIIWYKR